MNGSIIRLIWKTRLSLGETEFRNEISGFRKWNLDLGFLDLENGISK